MAKLWELREELHQLGLNTSNHKLRTQYQRWGSVLALGLIDIIAATEATEKQWATWGVIEIMVRNPNVDSFVKEKEEEIERLRRASPSGGLGSNAADGVDHGCKTGPIPAALGEAVRKLKFSCWFASNDGNGEWIPPTLTWDEADALRKAVAIAAKGPAPAAEPKSSWRDIGEAIEACARVAESYYQTGDHELGHFTSMIARSIRALLPSPPEG